MNLISLVLQAASGLRPHIGVFRRDYGTPDGSCIRDFIHIEDLCSAHWLALQSLMGGAVSQAYDLGNGYSFSVEEVIDIELRVTNRKVPVVNEPRRAGRPSLLIWTRSWRTLGYVSWAKFNWSPVQKPRNSHEC
jgi:UDP-glucose 4-epimerase